MPDPQPPSPAQPAKQHVFQAPTGTRDLYPVDLLRKRYIEKLWRDTSIRHGFEEIDGPTFEYTDLYKVKSGEGIVSEIFGVLSGKDEAELAKIRAGGATPYALRPEFTPTLARMYAARAGALPKPTKWFWMQSCYRAERPQRGRLREFGQWNCDIIGTDNEPEAQARGDADIIACVIGSLHEAGLTPAETRIKFSDRNLIHSLIRMSDVAEHNVPRIIAMLDGRSKDPSTFEREASALGLDMEVFVNLGRKLVQGAYDDGSDWREEGFWSGQDSDGTYRFDFRSLRRMLHEFRIVEHDWTVFDLGIVRGLAYYTGMVFEVIADGERAVAGGGRYDKLIELFDGPSTPAVGFGMGDVVLSLLLQDKGLMPDDGQIKDALSRPSASYNPEVFVISAGQTPEDQGAAAALVRPLVANLRCGTESKRWQDKPERKPWDADRYGTPDDGTDATPPLHARHSYKATKNIGKLLQDAAKANARFAVILESAETATIKDLRTGVQDPSPTPIEKLPSELRARLGV